jgi:hypothetical protein
MFECLIIALVLSFVVWLMAITYFVMSVRWRLLGLCRKHRCLRKQVDELEFADSCPQRQSESRINPCPGNIVDNC